MADKICPPVKPVPASDGIQLGSAHSVLTTPDPTYGRYFGAGTPGADAVNSMKIMGKK